MSLSAPPSNRRRTMLVRVTCVVVGLGLWFWTQSLIGSRRPQDPTKIDDALLSATADWNAELNSPAGKRTADVLLIVSSAIIDVLTLGMLGWSVVGPSVRPFLGLLILFVLRQVCQAVCALPAPDGMIWHDPGFPTVLVTYSVANDFFFSGHTALAVYGAVELARLGRWWWQALAVAIAVFECGVVLVLRAHSTMDVYAGIVTALYVSVLARQLAPTVDRWIARS